MDTECTECTARRSGTSGAAAQHTWASHAPPDNLLFKVKAHHRNLDKEVEAVGQHSNYVWKLFKYVNIKGGNYHSSNSSKRVSNSACFTGSAFPLGSLLAGGY